MRFLVDSAEVDTTKVRPAAKRALLDELAI